MRPRINRNALCSSDNYKASRRAHRQMLNTAHQNFIKECTCFMTVSHSDEPSGETLVYVTMFGIKKKLPYKIAKGANLKWSWV